MDDEELDPRLEYAWMLTGPSWCTEPTFSEFIEKLCQVTTRKHRLDDDLRALVLDLPSGTNYQTLLRLAPTDAARRELQGMHMVWDAVWYRG